MRTRRRRPPSAPLQSRFTAASATVTHAGRVRRAFAGGPRGLGLLASRLRLALADGFDRADTEGFRRADTGGLDDRLCTGIRAGRPARDGGRLSAGGGAAYRAAETATFPAAFPSTFRPGCRFVVRASLPPACDTVVVLRGAGTTDATPIVTVCLGAALLARLGDREARPRRGIGRSGRVQKRPRCQTAQRDGRDDGSPDRAGDKTLAHGFSAF